MYVANANSLKSSFPAAVAAKAECAPTDKKSKVATACIIESVASVEKPVITTATAVSSTSNTY